MNTGNLLQIGLNGLRICADGMPSSMIDSPEFRLKHKTPIVCNGTVAIRQESEPMLGPEAVAPNSGLWEAILGEPSPIIVSIENPVNPACLAHAPSPHVHRFLKANRLGMLRHENIYVPKLCAEIASAFPQNTVAIITPNNYIAGEVLYYLGLQGERDSSEQVTASLQPAWDKRVVVGSPYGMGHNSVEFEKREIILFVDASNALHERSQIALSTPDLRGNVFGFIPWNRRLTELQTKRLLATFGPKSISIAGYGLKRIEVKWRQFNFRGNTTRCGRTQLMQRGIFKNRYRNRFVCDRASEYLQSGNRVLVLAESVDQLAELAPLLPDWSPFLCSPAKIDEYPDHIQANIRPYCRFPDGTKCLSTVESALYCKMDVDVVVWAGSGHRLPRLNRKMLIAPSGSNKQLEFVDFMDRQHPQLRRWSRLRRNEYNKLGWIPCRIEEVR